MPSEREAATAGALSQDARQALRNAAKLSVSLAATWGIGLVVRFWMPRHLGPEGFGLLSFADGLAATALGCAGLGIDAFIQKEIPVRPQLATRFYAGTLALRVVLAAALVAGLLLLPFGGRAPDLRVLLLAFGAGYLFFTLNGSLAALLQANSTVDELAKVNVAAKVVWGLGMTAAILGGWPLAGFALVFAASEALKLALLQQTARRRLGLRFRVDIEATKATLAASLGFYANSVSQQLGWRLDVALLGLLASDADVGWYGASQTLAGMALLLAPILAAVLAPLYARALDRSRAEMIAVLRRALDGVLSLAVPLALLLSLGAETWMRLAFGAGFAQGAGALRALAPLFVLIYVSILLGTALMVQGRGWRLTFISLVGLALHAVFALLLVPPLRSSLGPGGAGTGMALAGVAKESVVACLMLFAVGTEVVDARRRRLLAATLVAGLAAALVYAVLQAPDLVRLALAFAAYAVLGVLLGAVRPADVAVLARELAPSWPRRAASR